MLQSNHEIKDFRNTEPLRRPNHASGSKEPSAWFGGLSAQIEHGSGSTLSDLRVANSHFIPHIGSRIRHCHTSIGFADVQSPLKTGKQ